MLAFLWSDNKPQMSWNLMVEKKKFPVKSWNQSFCYVEKLKKIQAL